MYLNCNSFVPLCFIFAAIWEEQGSISMKHAILHVSFIPRLCWKCVISFTLKPKAYKKWKHFFKQQLLLKDSVVQGYTGKFE